MRGVQDFIDSFGPELYKNVLNQAENHMDMCSSVLPEDEEQRLYYTLLKILDFECVSYGDAPKGITEEKIRDFLKIHKDVIRCEPPTYMGLMAGRFQFLQEDNK